MDEFEAVYVASTIDINICDHEQMNAEFARFARHVWNESARRADRQAREEIIDILENMPIGSGGQDDALTRAIRIIRATIPQEE